MLEVETPILSSAGNTDIHIESFTSQAIGNWQEKSYLRTSPEFPLKRLLCSGVGDIYELGKVFRRAEISSTHNIEFTMLEWYRLNFSYQDLIEEVDAFMKRLFNVFEVNYAKSQVKTFHECFDEYLSIDIKAIDVAELNHLCKRKGYDGSDLLIDEALDFLFATQIQPQFPEDALVFVTLYPASQAALAEINPDDSLTSLRFEVFFKGHELANAYQELTDGHELLQRFNADNNHRKKHDLEEILIDGYLIEAMNNGMPACSGIALGVDRLLMVLLGYKKVSEVMAFTAINA